jgi:signal peptidase II
MDKTKTIRLALVAGIVILIDQLTKYYILKNIAYGSDIPVINGLFSISHVHNPGGAFGFLADQSELVRKMMFLAFSFVATGFVYWLYKSVPVTHPMLANGLAMIGGGALGNLIDRVRFGWVVDFLHCYIGNFHWPSFNIADSAICIGVGIFIYHIVFNKMPDEHGFI